MPNSASLLTTPRRKMSNNKAWGRSSILVIKTVPKTTNYIPINLLTSDEINTYRAWSSTEEQGSTGNTLKGAHREWGSGTGTPRVAARQKSITWEKVSAKGLVQGSYWKKEVFLQADGSVLEISTPFLLSLIGSNAIRRGIRELYMTKFVSLQGRFKPNMSTSLKGNILNKLSSVDGGNKKKMRSRHTTWKQQGLVFVTGFRNLTFYHLYFPLSLKTYSVLGAIEAPLVGQGDVITGYSPPFWCWMTGGKSC